jgi:hypothetical protein
LRRRCPSQLPGSALDGPARPDGPARLDGQVQADVKGLKKAQAKDFDWQYPNDFFAK